MLNYESKQDTRISTQQDNLETQSRTNFFFCKL